MCGWRSQPRSTQWSVTVRVVPAINTVGVWERRQPSQPSPVSAWLQGISTSTQVQPRHQCFYPTAWVSKKCYGFTGPTSWKESKSLPMLKEVLWSDLHEICLLGPDPWLECWSKSSIFKKLVSKERSTVPVSKGEIYCDRWSFQRKNLIFRYLFYLLPHALARHRVMIKKIFNCVFH